MSRQNQALPRRVFMTADAVGGVWNYAVGVAQGLALRGVEVDLAVIGPHPGAEQLRAVEAIDKLFVVSTGLPLDWAASSEAEVVEATKQIREMAERAHADIAHLHAPGLVGRKPWAIPLVVSAHSCVGTWWRAVRGSAALPADLAWRALRTHEGLRLADVVIAPSRSFARSIEATYRLTRRVVAIHNGAPEQGKTYPAGRDGAIFTAGRLWDAGKDIAVLDAAAGRISHPVKAAGAAVGPNGARFTARNIELVGILGPDAMDEQYVKSSIFVSPALYEPFGLAVLEAAQRGSALVLSDIATFRELWDEAALFVPPGDVAALAAVLDKVASDQNLRRKLGGRARVRSQRYSTARCVDSTVQIYQRLLPAAVRGGIQSAAAGLR